MKIGSKHLSQLLKSCDYVNKSIKLDTVIHQLVYDSRLAGKASLFFAVKGEKEDGNNYIDDALLRGASAIITDNPSVYHKYSNKADVVLVKNVEMEMSKIADSFYDNILDKIQLIGITGTNGKTSTAIMTSEIIRSWNKGCGLLGTIYNDLGGKRIRSGITTPLSLDSIGSFHDMHGNGMHKVVMEVSSHSIYRNRIYGFPFYIGAITNISQDHLDYHKTFDNYRKVKFSFFAHIIEDGYCIIPYNMQKEKDLLEYIKDKKVITYNHPDADFFIRQKRLKDNMVLLWINGMGEEFTLSTNYFNDFMHENILLSIIISKLLGITNTYIVKALERISIIPGRVERIFNGRFDIFIDFAHTPDAILRVVKEFKDIYPERRLITVFGAGGNKDRDKRPKMGRNASLYSDIIILTSDNPRDEDPYDIIQDIYNGIDDDIKDKRAIYIEKDRKKALEHAVEMSESGDIILILGKGHETSMEIKGKYYDFDDKKVISDILGGYSAL